jgi:hypothetical protein
MKLAIALLVVVLIALIVFACESQPTAPVEQVGLDDKRGGSVRMCRKWECKSANWGGLFIRTCSWRTYRCDEKNVGQMGNPGGNKVAADSTR